MFCGKRMAARFVRKWIEKADGEMLSDMAQLLQRRYSELSPEWETVILSLPTVDLREREELLKRMVGFLRKHY